jgi:hypothetical protein
VQIDLLAGKVAMNLGGRAKVVEDPARVRCLREYSSAFPLPWRPRCTAPLCSPVEEGNVRVQQECPGIPRFKEWGRYVEDTLYFEHCTCAGQECGTQRAISTPVTAEEVVFLGMGSSVSQGRAETLLEMWGADVPASRLFIFSDVKNASLRMVAPAGAGGTSKWDAQKRQLLGLEWLATPEHAKKHGLHPAALKWAVFFDDDTWINTRLLLRYLAHFDHTQPLLVGKIVRRSLVKGGFIQKLFGGWGWGGAAYAIPYWLALEIGAARRRKEARFMAVPTSAVDIAIHNSALLLAPELVSVHSTRFDPNPDWEWICGLDRNKTEQIGMGGRKASRVRAHEISAVAVLHRFNVNPQILACMREYTKLWASPTKE